MSSKKEQSPSMTAAKYADILHLARPKPSHLHPRMQVENRAKIFSPFAALRGYEEEIAEEGIEGWKLRRKNQTMRTSRNPHNWKRKNQIQNFPKMQMREDELSESEEETEEIA